MTTDVRNIHPAWPNAAGPVRLPRQEIHAWLAVLDSGGKHKDEDDPRDLSESEILRAQSMRSATARREFVASRQVLRRLLGHYLGTAPAGIALCIDEHGKPGLVDCLGTALQFNVSHSAGHALFAFSCGMKIGADIDRLDRVAQWQSIVRQNFSAAERLALSALPPEQQGAAFMRNWIGKEAYTKARGKGFQYGFSRFSLASAEHSCTLLSDELDTNAAAEWSMVALDLAPPWAATLAFQGPPNLRVFCWNYRACDPGNE